MGKNRMAGNHPSYNERGMSESARKRKIAYDKQYQKKKVRYRVELNKKNRQAKTYGNGDGKDMSHTKSGRMVKEDQSTNRARNGHDGCSCLKK